MSKDQQKAKSTKDIAEELNAKAKPEALPEPNVEELEAKLIEVEAQKDEYHEKALRVAAEMENLRRRTERDIANAHKYALDKFAVELLPVIDSLERGIEGEYKDNELALKLHQGVELTLDMFVKAVAKFGLEVVNPLGEEFDPEKHEAMSMLKDEKAKPNTVIKVMQKGYLLNDRLIRPALVIVAN